MHFDALTLACVARELTHTLRPGRVQQVLPVDEQSVGLEVYAHGERRYLLASAAPDAARTHVVSAKLRRGVEKDSPLLLLLRKYVRDALLTDVLLPVPFERVLLLRFEHREHGPVSIVVEPIGRQANILLLDAHDTILECLRHVPAGEAGRRVLLPRRPYALPPAQAKLSPVDDGSPGYIDRLQAVLDTGGNAPLWKTLVGSVAGVSPTLAREAAWRAAQDGGPTPSAQDVAAALHALWAPLASGDWSPGVWRAGGEVAGFSAYHVHFAPGWEPAESISAAIETFYARPAAQRRTAAQTAPVSQAAVPPDGYAAQRLAVAALVARARTRVERQLAALAQDEPEPGAADALRRQAEWLLAMQHLVRPGDRELSVDTGEGTLAIPLVASEPPATQAQRMFKQAARMERAAVIIPQRRAALQNDLAFLDQLALDVAEARNQPELAAVREELARAGLLAQARAAQTARPVRGQSGGPAAFRAAGGLILVGRNARQNEQVTFGLAHPDDWWLHVRGYPGAHVVVRSDGREVSSATLHTAAQLAAYHSGARGESAVDVILARRKDVKRAPGGRTGQVTVRNEETLRVAAHMPEGVEAA